VQISPGGVGGVKDVALGGDRICARKADNTLWCWTTGSPVQVLIPGGRIPAVVAVGEHHACASATDFTLWCWGANDRGQLGNGSTTPSETPVQVLWLTGTPLVQDVTAGGSHTCAVSSDQKLWCWGDNQFGQLGRGNTSAQPSPSPDEVSVLGASVLDVTAGASHTCALRNSGTAWCFGANNAGQIGDEGTLPQPTPVQAAAFDSPVTVVNAGATRTCVAHAAAFWCTNRVGSQAPTVDLVELPCP
jgi:alpha-tubulin suppressor-like RCC1 family protein